MNVIAWSPNLTSERAADAGVTFIATKEELMKRSDIVSIHIVLSERTTKLIGANDFTLMKPSAIFINTSRGPIVDEDALLEALKNKNIAGAGLDVFDIEPLPLDHPFRDLSNVTLSPHMGYVSDDNYKVSVALLRPQSVTIMVCRHKVFWSQTVENIEAFLNGEPKRILQPPQ